MFTLAKWYLDLVTDDGTAIIGYAASIESRRVRVGYSSVLTSIAGAAACESSAFGQAGFPREEDTLVTWQPPALDVHGRWQRLGAPVRQRLIQTPEGECYWNCVMPHARAEIDLGGVRYSGFGYVEQLTLTRPPWHLPFNSLRWGRYASASHSIIWIAWRGADERQFIWYNGLPQPDAVLDEHGVRGLAGGTELRIGEPRDVCARPALARLMDGLPGPVRSLARPVAAMFEHKMVAPSRVLLASGRVDSGWSLFEDVQW